MAKLTTRQRKAIPKKTFGLPLERKYPMPDKSHAINAKARATQQYKRGNLTAAEYARINSKANRVIKDAGGTVSKNKPTKRVKK